MIKRLALLVIILLLTLPASVQAAEPGKGTIDGQLVNGTKDGSSVADQKITLKTYQKDNEIGSTTTQTDAQGRFILANLATDASYSYQVIPYYQGAEYSNTEQFTFAAGETTKSVKLTVYDATISATAIKIDTAHTIIYVGQGSLAIIELFSFSNESDRTYIGSGEITATGTRRTLKLPLPDMITKLQYGGKLMSCCVLQDKDGFFDTMPVFPGNKEVAYSYEVTYGSGAYNLSREVNFPTAQYDLLLQGEGIQVKSDQLTKGDPVTIEGAMFNRFSGTNLAPGGSLAVQLAGLPQTNRRLVTWVVLALVVVGGGFSFAYLRWRKGLQPVPVREGLAQRQQRLLAELAQLDDDFESGEIEEEAYRRRRAETKAQLVELMQRSPRARAKR